MNFKHAAPALLCLAAISASTAARADDLVRNSCDILIDAAKARAEEQARDVFAHLESQREATYYFGGATLPRITDTFRATIPERAYPLARDISDLRGQQAALEDESRSLKADIKDAEDRVRAAQDACPRCRPTEKSPIAKLQSRIQELKADLEAKQAKREDLASLEKAAEDQLANDMAVAVNRFDFAPTYPAGDRIFSLSQAYLPDRLAFRNCTGQFNVTYQDGPGQLCSIIDLVSGTTTYELAKAVTGGIVPVANFGSDSPVQASHDPMARARIRHGLRRQQIEPMPRVCKEPAETQFAKLAESDGLKATPSPAPVAAQVTAAGMSGQTAAR